MITAGAAWRAWIALTDEGIYWPDEIFQSFEQAHRLVFGYGITPHEFRDGLRTWALPGLVAILLTVARSIGLTEPLEYVHFVKLVFVTISAGTIWGSYLLSRRYGAERFFAATGSAFFALAAPAVYLGPRALSENASALAIVVGLACILPRGAPPVRLVAGSILLGLAVIFRLQTALICIGVVMVLSIQQRIRALLTTSGVLLICAVALGLLDKLTWGGWFHSAIGHLRFNLLEGRALEWGRQPASYYLVVSWTSIGALFVVAALTAVAAVRRAWPLWLITILFVAAHSVTPHKELRFILPALPLLGSLSGIGLHELARARRLPAYVAAAVLLALAAWQCRTLDTLTMREVGQYGPAEERTALNGEEHKINRLLALAGRRHDLCGILVQHAPWAWTGGYTYLHRRVPLYGKGDLVNPGWINYSIAPWDPKSVEEIVAIEGRVALIRTQATCIPDPTYSYFR